MSTPAKVRKEHHALWDKLHPLAFNECFWNDSSDAPATQLIADSEAKACAELRAEVERLREWQAGVIANERLHYDERKDAIARAEKAEAELHALRLICGTTDADKFSTWVDRANARAEEAEHDCRVLIVQLNVAKDELAIEREKSERYRLASLKLDAELITERQKVRALTAILESICEEWGRNHDANPIGAGQRMETLASKALEDMEDAQ